MSQARAASQTAVLVAAYRARASAGTNPVCNDPWAKGLAGDAGDAFSRRWDEHAPAMELWVGLRTRYIDDCVVHALEGGIGQVVYYLAEESARSTFRRLATEFDPRSLLVFLREQQYGQVE